MIPPQTLDDIRSRLDIVELVGEYVQGMQRAGRNMKARCPFHQERTPSFIVSSERQTFHCFGCGEGGDAFGFVMKIENLTFMEAVEKLAERVGVKLAKAEGPLGPAEKERLKIRELLATAAEYYHNFLLRASQAEPARRYLAERKVSAATIETFKIGYAPKAGELGALALKKGFTKDLLLKAGLCAEAKGTGRLRDYFYDRVLYPISDAKGAVVGFGARTLGDGMPKYLNSPDSPVFSKGRVLYGLPQGLPAIRKGRRALLMEGYMDVMAAHQHGLTTAVAPLGTALTTEHAALLKRYASEAVIVFDADSAGLNAAVRGAEILLAAGMGVRIATVPQGKDPDEHLHAFGPASFQKCLDAAVDLVEFKTGLLLKDAPRPLTPETKSAVAKQILATIEQCPDEILKAEWTRRLAQRLDVREETLRAAKPSAARTYARPKREEKALETEVPASDLQILALLFQRPALAREVGEADLASPPARRIRAALAAVEAAERSWSSRLLEALPESDRPAVSKLLVDDRPFDEPEKLLKELLSRRRFQTRYEELRARLRAGELPEAEMEEYKNLTIELKGTRRQ